MTASTVYADGATNSRLAPRVYNDRKDAILHIESDHIAAATTSIDEVGDTMLFMALPSNAVLSSLKMFNDDLDSNGTPTLAADIGLYYNGDNRGQPTKVQGDVLSAGCIATAVTTLQSANILGVEHRYEAADIITYGKKLWELGGLSADCGGSLLIGLKVTTQAATAAAGDIVLVAQYY